MAAHLKVHIPKFVREHRICLKCEKPFISEKGEDARLCSKCKVSNIKNYSHSFNVYNIPLARYKRVNNPIEDESLTYHPK